MSKLSYVRSNEAYYAEYKTIPQLLKELAHTNPDKELAVIYATNGVRQSITYSEVYKRSQQFGRVLSTLGVRKGERVMVYLYNTIEWLIIVFGLMSIGAVPVNSYIIKTDLSDLVHSLQRTDAVGLFFTEEDSNIKPGIKRILKNGSSGIKFAVSTDILEDDGPVLSYHKLLREIKPHGDFDDVYLDPDNEAYIMRTSGTTGVPKLMSHSHQSLITGINFYANLGKKRLTNFDFPYFGGSPFIEVCNESTQVTVSGNTSEVPVDTLLQYASKESCDILELSQCALNVLMRDKLHIPACIKTVIVGGAPIKTKCNYLSDKVDLLMCYYSTSELLDLSKIEVKKGMTVEDNIGGYPSQNVEIKVVDDNNAVVKRGTTGHIFARTSRMFLEYIGDEEATKDAVSISGWYKTRDIGYLSECGKLFVIGRDGDCIMRGSEILYATELEKVIEGTNIECIQDCIVVPVPDELHNEETCACIIRKSEYTSTEEDILHLFNDMILELFYVPRYVVFVDSFPVSQNGKVNRKKLKDMAVKIISKQQSV